MRFWPEGSITCPSRQNTTHILTVRYGISVLTTYAEDSEQIQNKQHSLHKATIALFSNEYELSNATVFTLVLACSCYLPLSCEVVCQAMMQSTMDQISQSRHCFIGTRDFPVLPKYLIVDQIQAKYHVLAGYKHDTSLKQTFFLGCNLSTTAKLKQMLLRFG